MTRKTYAAGNHPGGEPDVRSTATVDGILLCGCGEVRRCVACSDAATLTFGRDAYCDIHGGDVLRLPVLRTMLYYRSTPDFGGVVGQASFVRFHPYYARRSRLDVPLRTQSFRHGDVECAKCGASWVGVEHSLCEWCYDRAVRRRWADDVRSKAAA